MPIALRTVSGLAPSGSLYGQRCLELPCGANSFGQAGRLGIDGISSGQSHRAGGGMDFLIDVVAEHSAEISTTGVNRIALLGDRIAKVVRAPDGYAVEHDGASGDLYLRPSAPAASRDRAGGPITLFIGTEQGFT
ncbi:MAG: type-F conjugative transfer system secretin TraK [Boseongicola sp.]|nr:type-F conjugative transfer system secretin TraK [Boseongicola sp.]